MGYSIESSKSSKDMARMCRGGCCPVKDSIFLCPFSYGLADADSACCKVDASMWDSIAVEGPLTEEEQRERDIEYNLARKACVEGLVRSLKPNDLINRMSLEGELHEIEKEIERLRAEA